MSEGLYSPSCDLHTPSVVTSSFLLNSKAGYKHSHFHTAARELLQIFLKTPVCNSPQTSSANIKIPPCLSIHCLNYEEHKVSVELGSCSFKKSLQKPSMYYYSWQQHILNFPLVLKVDMRSELVPPFAEPQ